MKISSLILPIAFFTHTAFAALGYFSCAGGTPENACSIAAFSTADCFDYGTLSGCDGSGKSCKYCVVPNNNGYRFQSAIGDLIRICSGKNGKILQSSADDNNLPICP